MFEYSVTPLFGSRTTISLAVGNGGTFRCRLIIQILFTVTETTKQMQMRYLGVTVSQLSSLRKK